MSILSVRGRDARRRELRWAALWVVVLGPVRPPLEHGRPPPLDRGEVPEQVVGRPVRAGRDPGRRIHVGEGFPEPAGLVGDVG